MVGPATHEARVDLMIDTDTDTRTYLYICTSKYIHPKKRTGGGVLLPEGAQDEPAVLHRGPLQLHALVRAVV